MKILTKLLNIILVILVISGIVFPILYFTTIKKNKAQYEEALIKNAKLTEQIAKDYAILRTLDDSIVAKDAEIIRHKDKISNLMSVNSYIQAQLNEQLAELSDMTLEQILNYLRDYYNTDSTEINIVSYENEIRVLIQPRLIREWANDVTKLESVQIEALGYKKQVSEYELLVGDYDSKIALMDSTSLIKDDIIKSEQGKNSNFQSIIDSRNKVIKSIKMQRNIVGGVAIGVIILILI